MSPVEKQREGVEEMKTGILAGLAVMVALGAWGWAWGQEAPVTRPTPTVETAEPGETGEEPQVVQVGVYILSIGKFDIGTGGFTVDFYLSLKSDKEIPETWEFMNGRGNLEKIIDKPTEKFYRVLANLNSKIDLKKFPFDTQRLQVIIEDKVKTTAELVYVPEKDDQGKEQSDLDASVVFPGWQITGWTTRVSEHEYPVYGERYSQYQFDVDITRIKMNSFLKTFLPVLFLMLIMTSSFILNPDAIVTRLATISSSLVASVMFHLAIANQVPPVGYLTFADKFMVLTYLILLLSFFLNIGVFMYQSRGDAGKEKAKKLSKLCEKLVFIGVPVLYLGLFLFVR